MTKSTRMSGYLDVLKRTAEARRDSLALADEQREVTYGQLLNEVNNRASLLKNAGLRSGDRVAFVAENSVEYVMTALAVWQADGVPVTIYPSTSAADLSNTLADADPVLVFCDTQTRDLAETAVRDYLPVASLVFDFPPAVLASDARQTDLALRQDLAMICYSSGTTDRPKAIMLSGSALVNASRTFSEVWRLSEEDVTLVCLPMAWLYGLTTSTLSTLYAGGAVVSRRRSKPELLANTIEQHGVTVFPAVTTVLTKLANFLRDSERKWNFSSLRFIISGGEPRNEQSFSLLKTFTGLSVHDNYCASEMQPLVTYDPAVDVSPRPGSAGRLVPRSELLIVNAEGKEVSPGEVGEGFSRGAGIMLGYWNDPELTKEALTPDGWYRTKDLLKVDEEGYVYVVGRTSDMIIRGGSNVSPGEVEAKLREHAEVVDVAVVGVPDTTYGQEVVAVLQVRNQENFSPTDLREFAAARLSGFKVPTRFICVDELPLNTTTNKVNRKAVKTMLEEGILL